MADFLTRLTERALGMAPVVQPLNASMFAPEPTSHSLDLEWDSEALTSSGNPDRVLAPPAVETPTALDAPKMVPEDTTMAQREEQGASTRITPPARSETSDVSPELHHHTEPASAEHGITSRQNGRSIAAPTTSNHPARMLNPAELDMFEGRVASRQEDRQNPSRATTRHPQASPEPQSETSHRAEPRPTQHDVLSTSRRVLPKNLPFSPSSTEDQSGQIVPRPIRTLMDRDQSATLVSVLSRNTEASLEANEGTLESQATLDRPVLSAAAPPVVPRMVRPLLNGYPERGPREPRVAAPGPPAPTIRVAIGRIEVRAVTPPPARPPTPARTPPSLSLDDYLKQRNGGQR